MTPGAERYSRLQELFDAVVDLPAEERRAELEKQCDGDTALCQEVEALLTADVQAGSLDEQFTLQIPADLFSDEPEEQLAGRRFGAYQIIREIGRGGLGAVYLAARADDEYRKEVALKLIRRGLDTDDILRRFRNERQILAQLDHPNIARLLDGGTSDDGLPYFVMEYVKGEPLGAYCDTRRLSTQQRIDLFRRVCAAVTYAHQNLVIHRDLKPSNILVTSEGEPKLLDFGIAKLLDTEEEMFTQTAPGLRAMTPDYASPEQIKGGKITTASDVYSLGVLLYELLSGQKPYRLKTASAEELSRAIAEQEPPRPSTAVAKRDGNSKFEIRNSKFLEGDLDNIVLKALRKEPERRYSSVEALADDLRRYQEGRPVSARPSTFSYRAGKFVRRNKVAVLAATLILMAVVGGLIATERQASIARTERAKAEKRFNDVRKLANSNLFEVYPVLENLEGSLKAREAILRNALGYLDSLSKEAHGDVPLQSELASAYEKVGDVQGALNTSSLGKTAAALESYAKATALRRAVLADRPGDLEAKKALANNVYIAARTLWSDSRTEDAEKAFEEALRLQRELIKAQPDSIEFQNRLAVLLIDYGAIPIFNFQAEKALVLFNEALEINRALRQKAPDDVELKKTRARCLRILSKAKTAFGDYAGGREALNEAHSLSRELAEQFPKDFRLQRSVWLTETMTCELLIDKGDGEEGRQRCEETVAFPKAALRNEPENGVVAYDLAISYFNAARANRLARNFPATITQAEAAIEVMSKLSVTAPKNNEYRRNLAIYRTELARAQLELDQPQAALAALQEARETLRPIVEADPGSTTYRYDLGFAHRLEAQAFHRLGDKSAARAHIDEAITIFIRLNEQKSLRESDKVILQEMEQERSAYSR